MKGVFWHRETLASKTSESYRNLFLEMLGVFVKVRSNRYQAFICTARCHRSQQLLPEAGFAKRAEHPLFDRINFLLWSWGCGKKNKEGEAWLLSAGQGPKIWQERTIWHQQRNPRKDSTP